MRRLSRILNIIEETFEVVSQIMVLLIMLLITADVFMRTAFNKPLAGVAEFVTIMLIFIIYLGLPHTQAQEGHIRIDMVIRRIRGKPREVIEILTLLLSLAVMSIMFWRTAIVGIKAMLIGDYNQGLISIPLWPGKLTIAIGLLFLCIRIAFQIGHRAAGLRKPGGPETRTVDTGGVSP